MRIAFLHPNLGIGGAERLVVDAAVSLVNLNHHVTMYTSYYNPERSFDETKNGMFQVHVYGDWLPEECCNMGKILFAILRGIWLALMVGFSCSKYDVYICDQLSIYVPILRILAPRTKILFYCHFPDQLLSNRTTCLKSLYRIPFDALEQVTTALSDRVLVNSKFTKGVYHRTFSIVAKDPYVLYPCVFLDELVKIGAEPTPTNDNEIILLSINRFERKKNIALAVEALVELRELVKSEVYDRVKLILAGGYDKNLLENVEYYEEIQEVVQKGKVEDKIEYKLDFSDAEKLDLLSSCTAVVYTPENEHFGIVPIEGMAASRPVLATNSGGPMESVAHEKTGFLQDITAKSFAKGMASLVKYPMKSKLMGENGRKRVIQMFSRDSFGEQLEHHCEILVKKEGFPLVPVAISYSPVVIVLSIASYYFL
jgi:glycosyltransferase involved in cell wall biosynthesis